MHPRALISDVDELEEVLVEACFLAGGPKQWLMGPGGTRRHEDAVQVVVLDLLLDGRDSFFQQV